MRVNILRTLGIVVLLFRFAYSYAGQVPQVYYNANTFNLNIRSSPSSSGSVLTTLAPGARICAESIVSNSSDATFYNWIKVCLPNTNGSLTYGYMAVNEFYTNIYSVNTYATVITAQLNIRPSAGNTSSNVTIAGSNATFANNTLVALTSSAPVNVSGTLWYEVYLPNNCSQSTGWVSRGATGSYLSVNTVTSDYYIVAGRVCKTASECNYGGSINGAFVDLGSLGTTYSSSGYYQLKVPQGSNVNVTCSYSGYNTSTPNSYRYTANTHLYDRNFVLSNTTVPKPSPPANLQITSIDDKSATLQWSAVSGSSITYEIFYNASSCGNTFTSTGITTSNTNATVNGLNSSTTYYFVVKASNSGGTSDPSNCAVGTTKTPCTKPGAPSLYSPSGITSSQVTLSWSAVNTATNGYEVYVSTGTSCAAPSLYQTVSQSQTSLDVKNLNPNTDYSFYVVAVGACKSDPSNCRTVKTFSGPSIVIDDANSTVPPWQREGDDLMGEIAFNYSGMNKGSKINLDIYVNGVLAITQSSITLTQSSGSGKFKFYVQPYSLMPNYPLDGSNVGYQIIDYATQTYCDVDVKTKIIESNWNKKNLYYHNVKGESIKIPVPYNNLKPVTRITIKRFGNVSYRYLGDLNKLNITDVPESILNINRLPDLTYSGKTGFLTIDYDNSNIETVLPGDFELYYWSNEEFVQSATFSLCKYGRIFPSSPINNHLAIAIGGIFNEIEGNSFKLRELGLIEASKSDCESSFSVMGYLEKSGFNAWYIAQGNANSIARNGYDIGKALELILGKNSSATDVNFICHSKGGLDVRAFLSDYTRSFDNSKYYGVGSFSLRGLIKKVVFLGTPHNGAPIANWLVNWSLINSCPGTMDLRASGSSNLETLKLLPFKINVEVLNLTGFRSEIGTTDYNNGVLIGKVRAYLNSENDGVVPIWSSNLLNLKNSTGNSPIVKQLYQHGEHLLTHFEEHKNYFLSQNTPYHYKLDCSRPITNLEKIVKFLGNSTVVSSCPYPDFNPIVISTYKSVLTNCAVIQRKPSDSVYINLGKTDDNGNIQIGGMNILEVGDTLYFIATNVQIQKVVLTKYMLENKKLKVSMFHTDHPTIGIEYPVFITYKTGPIVSNPSITMELHAKNAISFDREVRIDSSIKYIPLNSLDDFVTINLDTGYNDLKVRINGASDSIFVHKTVYYYPDTLLNYYSRRIHIMVPDYLKGVNIYVDDIYYETLNSVDNLVRVLRENRKCKFSILGYKDTIMKIDTLEFIDLKMEPTSYSSKTDSVFMQFDNTWNINYWRNISVRKIDNSSSNIISIKQFDDSIIDKGLFPLSRKFEFRNLSIIQKPDLRVAICLDQPYHINRDSSYLVMCYDNQRYMKLDFSDTGICDYEPNVQKLSINLLDFDSSRAEIQSFAIAKRLAPVKKAFELKMGPSDSFSLPISAFFTDPDSLKGDMSIHMVNSTKGINATLNSGILTLKVNNKLFGLNSFTVSATHDGLTENNEVKVRVFADSFAVFPNPTDRILHVNFILLKNETVAVKLYDMKGNLVQSEKQEGTIGLNELKVDLDKLMDGIYVYRVTVGDRVKVGRVAKR
ncbi:MAG: fibronectin type III domain-containing protein [Bacteroidetes bacterium]|nr:fibronectin type III domain-containing protein [Bacteroidota bacterium]